MQLDEFQIKTEAKQNKIIIAISLFWGFVIVSMIIAAVGSLFYGSSENYYNIFYLLGLSLLSSALTYVTYHFYKRRERARQLLEIILWIIVIVMSAVALVFIYFTFTTNDLNTSGLLLGFAAFLIIPVLVPVVVMLYFVRGKAIKDAMIK